MSTNQFVEGSNIIPLSEAIIMNERYRNCKNKILAPGVDPNVLPICETFGRADFDALFAQTDCVGIRLYFSMKENQDVCIVAVGVNSKNEDILSAGDSIAGSGSDAIIIDNGTRCPYYCPPDSPLN